jgi:hypothetical protein
MKTRSLSGAIATAVFGALLVAAAVAAGERDQPKLQTFGGVANQGFDFLGGTLVYEAKGPPVACYGYVKLKDKTRYTYFVLFKADPKKHKPCGILGDGVDGSGPVADLKITITAGDTKFQYTYKIKADSKAGTVESESLTIDGKEYDKKIPQLFLVDLTQEKMACRVVKDAKIELEAGQEFAALEKTIFGLKKNNKEVKEFFEGKAKK